MSIVVFSWINVSSHELEFLKYFLNNNNYEINFIVSKNLLEKWIYPLLSERDKLKILLEFPGNHILWESNTIIFLNYIPKNDFIEKIKDYKNNYVFIWNIFNSSLTNDNIEKLKVYNFYKYVDTNNIFKEKFTKAFINNVFNINYPSWILWFIDKNIKRYSNKYLYDIVITLWWALDFFLIDDIINNIWDKKILIIWKNHPHKDVLKNLAIIERWWEKENISLVNMLSEKRLYILLKVSRIWLLPLINNHQRDLTRISDLLLLWKTIITTKNESTKNIDNLVFCRDLWEFLYKINYFLQDNRYNYTDSFNKIRKYYIDNFSINEILDDCLKVFIR